MFEKSSNGKILYIRHGETYYNKKLISSENTKEVQIDEFYIDSNLSEEGRRQAEGLAENLKDLKIKFVFSSPLNRCLETTHSALKSHPNRANIKVIIHPQITEVIHGAQDIAKNILKKKEIYNENSEIFYDWTLFDEFYTISDEAEFYFLTFIDNIPSDDDAIHYLINDLMESKNKEGKYAKILSHFLLNNKRPETLQHLFQRSKKFKNFLKIFLDENPTDDSETKIAVVTHSAFIRMSTSAEGNKKERLDAYPEDCYKPDNCEIISLNLN
jgi:broad specificity phosphatase PhoE